MSKFYVQGNMSDDSDDNEQSNNANIDKNKKKKFDVDDDQYHEEKNKMQTEKQKKTALFKKLSNATLGAVKISDFDKAWDNLQEFIKEIQKSAKYIEREGIPNSFLRTLKIVSEEVTKVDPQTKKNMKNPKSFNILRQKLKNKVLPQYKDKLDSFKDEASEESQISEPESISSQSSQEEEEIYKKYLESDDPHIRRRYWLKRDQNEKEEREKEEKEEKDKEDKQEKEEKKRKASNQNKPKYHLAVQKQKEETIIASAKEAEAKIGKILKQYAKLSTAEKRQEYLETLNSILKQSKNYKDFEKLSLLLVDIPIRMEVTRQLTKQYNETNFPRTSWNKIFNNVVSIFNLIRDTEDEDLFEKIATFEENNEEATLGITQKEVYYQIKSFVNDLARELARSFDFLESSQLQYSERLQDLIKFVDFMYRVSKEMTFKSDLEREAAELSFKVLENMYFLSNDSIQKIAKTSSDLTFTELSDQNTLEDYAKAIIKLNNQDYTTKTLLYLIYNHAINRRDKGKDLLSLTDISETVLTRDYYTQVCFNRALVQLGISAFHQGNLYECQQILSNICSVGKNRDENKEHIKLFLGQAKSSDKEIARHKILPYYLHLSVELIETIELIASMILEVPFTLTEGGKITSRSFKKLAYQFEKSHFIAEPLNYRDLVYAASNDLKQGNMKECFEKLKEIDIWNSLGNRDEALENLKVNIKETALRCYIFANRDCFTTLSIEGLTKKFDMEYKAVRKIICREINEKKMSATITADGYLKLNEKRKEKESGLRSINNKLFMKLEELNRNNEQIFKERHDAGPEEEDEVDKEQKTTRRLHDAITDKLKNILSRRAA